MKKGKNMKILNKTDHFFVLGFIFGTLYLLSNFVQDIQLKTTVPAVMVLYIGFFALMTFRSVKGSIYQKYCGQRLQRFNDKGVVVSNTPELAPVYKTKLDLYNHIVKRNNRNLFIAGRSGSGKTTLMRYIIELFPNSNKVIFSFKAHDDYLKLGIPILQISQYAANPFTDKEAFCQAFLVANPISLQGITSSSATSLLRSLLTKNKSNTWEELEGSIIKERDETTDRITISAYTYILQKIQDLKLASTAQQIDMNQSVVLDFSGLNESAKSFYSELYLRQAWKTIEASQPEPMKYIIIIDEAHRLLKSDATIFNDVARLIRSKGALWCGTQNYSDILDSVRNQFAMHFIFSTKSERDIKALAAINDLFPFVATELEDQHFTDAAMLKLHKSIPIYTADISKFKDMETSYIRPEHLESVEIEAKPKEMPDYREKVLKMLTEEASWPSKLAKDIAKEEGLKEEPKLAISKALKVLQNDGTIGRQMIKLEDREVMLYYKKDPSISGFHKFMEREVTKKLKEKGINYELAQQGEDKPDIITKDFDIEIETGLKHDLRELEKKITNAKKKTFVVLPNEVEIDRYKKIVNTSIIVIASIDKLWETQTD